MTGFTVPPLYHSHGPFGIGRRGSWTTMRVCSLANVGLALQGRRCVFINSINLSVRSYNALRGILSVADASQMLVQTMLSSLLNNTRLTLCLKYSLGRPLDELLPLGLMGPYPPSCPCPLFPTHHQDTSLPISYSCVVLHLLCRMALWGL